MSTRVLALSIVLAASAAALLYTQATQAQSKYHTLDQPPTNRESVVTVAQSIAADPTKRLTLIDASAGSIQITLPTHEDMLEAGAVKRSYACRYKRIDSSANTVTLVPASGLIDNATTKLLAPLDNAPVYSDGTNYWIARSAPGPKGDKGDTGVIGPAGPAGTAGVTGAQGPAGVNATTTATATTATDGLMSAADKLKLSKTASRTYVATGTKTVTNTAGETSCVPTGTGSLVVPSAVFDTPGYTFTFESQGVYSNALTGVLTLRIKLGNQVTLQLTNLALPLLSNRAWWAEGRGTVRNGRVLISHAKMHYDDGTKFETVAFANTSVVMTAGDKTADMTAQWNLALLGASFTVDQLNLNITPTP